MEYGDKPEKTTATANTNPGETGTLAFPFMLLGWVLVKRNLWISAILMGLAMTVKQTSFFLVLFYLILIYRTVVPKQALISAGIMMDQFHGRADERGLLPAGSRLDHHGQQRPGGHSIDGNIHADGRYRSRRRINLVLLELPQVSEYGADPGFLCFVLGLAQPMVIFLLYRHNCINGSYF